MTPETRLWQMARSRAQAQIWHTAAVAVMWSIAMILIFLYPLIGRMTNGSVMVNVATGGSEITVEEGDGDG